MLKCWRDRKTDMNSQKCVLYIETEMQTGTWDGHDRGFILETESVHIMHIENSTRNMGRVTGGASKEQCQPVSLYSSGNDIDCSSANQGIRNRCGGGQTGRLREDE
ncbi:hypothetical protein GOODEAATRI_009174 [Goodea atripinnis]|uniref:Uncharacterized protein n=1 Tax=Goodea atripinnis TaxID=208336 RepID=A0ABV0MQM3_9TELE